MEKTKKFKFETIGKILLCLLCCFMLVNFVSKPITAHASATVLFGSSAYAIVSILIGSGFTFVLADDIKHVVDCYTDFIGSTTNWAKPGTDEYILDQLFTSVANKTSFHLGEKQRNAFISVLLKYPSIASALKHESVDLSQDDLKEEDIPIIPINVEMHVPTDKALEDVTSITMSQVLESGFYTSDSTVRAFTADVIFHLNVINNNLMKRLEAIPSAVSDLRTALAYRIEGISNTLVNTRTELNTGLSEIRISLAQRIDNVFNTLTDTRDVLKGSIESVKSHVSVQIGTVTNSINELKTSLSYRTDNIYNTLLGVRDILSENLLSLRTNLSTKIEAVTTAVNDVKSSLAYRVDGVKTAVNSLKESIADVVSTKVGAVEKTLEVISGKVDTLTKTLTDLFVGSDDVVLDNIGAAEGELKGQVNQGNVNSDIYIGKGKDLISKYRIAFLAVGALLVKFFELPVIGDLVVFSLALGIFALIVNLGNSILSKSDGYTNRGNKNSKVKGG